MNIILLEAMCIMAPCVDKKSVPKMSSDESDGVMWMSIGLFVIG
jgi:hypothetical protein